MFGLGKEHTLLKTALRANDAIDLSYPEPELINFSIPVLLSIIKNSTSSFSDILTSNLNSAESTNSRCNSELITGVILLIIILVIPFLPNNSKYILYNLNFFSSSLILKMNLLFSSILELRFLILFLESPILTLTPSLSTVNTSNLISALRMVSSIFLFSSNLI